MQSHDFGRTGHKPRRPSAGWWLLTTANEAGTNGFTCLLKHGGARDDTFLVTHPMIGLCESCLTSTLCTVAYFSVCTNTRRIVLGNPTLSDKGYMVYFLKSDKSENNEYDSWLCGGAIVSPTHILTAAACINDVSHLWVIAGYRKYVRSEYLEEDECTKNKKQRVIRTCTPKKYDFNYSNYTKWMAIDIGFAIVEKPYNFSDTTYRLRCSYVPKPIAINYEPTYTESERHMMIYGWGHSRGLRLPGDMTNYNSLYLQAASTKTVSKKYCMEFFKKEPLMNNTIAAYMICTIGAGNLDSEGNIIDPGVYNYNNGCSRKQMGVDGKCNHDYDSFESRRNGSGTMDNFNNTSGHQYNRTAKTNETRRRKIPTRRQGICTNDHGGPLVTWVGAKEMVVGIASSSLYDENYFCIAPSLYTSTHCVMRFLMCGMHMGNAKTKDGRRLCKNLKEEEGYELDERDVDWGGYTVKSNEKNNSKYSYGMSEKSNHQGDTQNLDQYTSDNPYREDAIDILEQDTDDLEAIVDVVDSY